MNDEKLVWRGHPSQVVNLGAYLLCLLLCWLVVPIFIGLWKWIENRCRIYEVTSQRVKVSSGVFTRKTEDLELYRVRDIALLEPFWLRLFGLGNLVLTTNDVSSPSLTLLAVPEVHQLREELRQHIETCRDQKRVRVAEFEEGDLTT